MKNILTTLLLSTALFSSVYTKQDRIKDMQVMAEAMTTIETGFFYNNNDIVQNGALSLSDAIRRIKPPLEVKEEKDPMARYMNNKVVFSNKIVKTIDKKAKIIIERFAVGDVQAATQAYTKIMKQCMRCHHEIRQW
ncbi:cytochrome C [Sulfurimonas sp.]|uniref:cytochrome C n=1 Tax=Sulfurimonas sp. TaxID=2022749 RepID=UPI002B4A8FE4|nr:cytochrome C [Sulfurimonas sp.]